MSTVMETSLPENNSFKKAVAPVVVALQAIGKVFVRIFETIVEARRLKSAYETATYLRMYNKDFKNMTHHELVQWILNKDNS